MTRVLAAAARSTRDAADAGLHALRPSAAACGVSPWPDEAIPDGLAE